MSVRRAIAEADTSTLNVAAFCRLHGISRDRFYAIRRRYDAEGEAGLEPRSRAPHRVANRTPDHVEDLVVALRKELTEAGLDAGAATIEWHLQQRGVDAPSAATIWRILTRRGFITPEPKKRPKRTWRSFAAEFGNEWWQIDTTHWSLADGTEVAIINIIDDCTRVAVASVVFDKPRTSGVDAWETVLLGAEQWGFPAAVLSDNGAEFSAKAFCDNLAVLGIDTGHSRPYHPQTCGKVERFHQTLKRFLAVQPDAATTGELQHHLDQFLSIYNQHRPHRSLGRQTPAAIHAATPTIGPAPTAAGQPTRIHHNTVNTQGVVDIPGPSAISLGVRYAGETATTIRTGNHTHVFINHQLARALTINPTQRYQPLHPRPSRSTP